MTATNGRERGSQGLGEFTSDSSEFLCIHISKYLCVLEADVCLSLGIKSAPEHECTPFLCRARCRPHRYAIVSKCKVDKVRAPVKEVQNVNVPPHPTASHSVKHQYCFKCQANDRLLMTSSDLHGTQTRIEMENRVTSNN